MKYRHGRIRFWILGWVSPKVLLRLKRVFGGTMSRWSRRKFLYSAGAAAVAGPFFNLLQQRAHAAELGAAKRLVIFFSPNGTIPQLHWPTGSASSWSFGAGTAFEPLSPIKDDLLVLKGLDFYNATNHEGGMSCMLTGNGGASDTNKGMSIDQYVASTLSAGMRFPSLTLGAWTSPWGGSIQTRMSYSGVGSFVTPDDNPSNVYQRMFGDVGASEADKQKLRERRLSVIDLVRDELNTLQSGLGTAERHKLDIHLDAIRDVENSLTASSGLCEPPSPPDALNLADYENFPDIVRSQIDLGTQALACGMTNVVTLQMTHTVSPVAFSWLGVNDGHHSLSHSADSDASGTANYIQCERWFSEQFLYLVNRLQALSDPMTGGSLMDDTLVLWAQEMGDGRLHVCTDVPFIIAGNAGGTFSTGRFLDFGGIYHNRLLVSVANALGFDINTFGDPDGGTGALEELR